jgi:predicted amidophosphoribosyltransferase
MTTKTICTKCGGEHRRDAWICAACEKAIKQDNLAKFGRVLYGKRGR